MADLLAIYTTQAEMSSFFIDKMGITSVKSYGATGDGVTDDTAAIRAAINVCETNGSILFFPVGTYLFDTLTFSPMKFIVQGSGTSTILKCTNTSGSNAISITSIEDNWALIKFKDFKLTGNASCGHGIKYDTTTSNFALSIENVHISDFTNTGKYALWLQKLYSCKALGLKINNCANGVKIDTLVLYTEFDTCWIRNCTNYHVHVNAADCFNTYLHNCIIDNDTPQSGQIGIYVEDGTIEIQKSHIESIDKAFHVKLGGKVIFKETNMYVMTIPPTIEPGAQVIFGERTTGLLGWWLAGSLGVLHKDNTVIMYPADYLIITDSVALFNGTNEYASSVVNITAESGVTIYGLTSASVWECEEITLNFKDNNVTLAADGSAWLVNAFYLKGNKNWRPMANDEITFKRRRKSGAVVWWDEISRKERNKIVHCTANTNVLEADHERTFTNQGASGSVVFQLYDTTLSTVGTLLTFIKIANQTLQIDPYLTETIRGGGAGKYLQLTNIGDSVTLYQSANAQWEIIAANGAYTFEL